MTNICQSCGMPLSKDPNNGGTNSDATRSETYCSFCYENGEFLQPDFSVSDMQEHCIKQLNGRGMPTFMGWLFTRGIPKLARWKQ